MPRGPATTMTEHVCRDPQGCAARAAYYDKLDSQRLPLAQKEWDNLHDNARFVLTETRADGGVAHPEQRLYERAVSRSDVDALIAAGDVIRRYTDDEGHVRLLILGWVKTAPKRYRPLHMVTVVVAPDEVHVATVYDPRTRPWQWSPEYDRQVCWCG